MTSASRFFVTMALASLLLSLAVLVVPEGGLLGPAPAANDALSWLLGAGSTPWVLAPLGLAALLFAWVKTRPAPAAVLRPQAELAPLPAAVPGGERLAATRAAFTAAAPSSDGAALAELLVQAGVRLSVSDVHLQPAADGTDVSLRIDGALSPLGRLSPPQYAQLVNRLKVLARLTHYVSDKPQDGQFSMQTADGPAEVRVSLLPTQHGEKAVLRFAGRVGDAGPRLDALDLADSVRAQLTRVLERPSGLIFFTGPTGSGKTTSIYASVAHLQETRGALAQIATIEDPVERSLPGVAQTQVNRAAGLDFAAGLRALLRQDPNVIVVGEIRDVETARIATQAALTGHLILTTVHADSAAGVFTRLLEMGVEPAVLSSVSLAVFSQRLLRRLCPHCRRPGPPSDEERAQLEARGEPVTGYFRAPGCDECSGSGVLGRTGVFEVMVVTDPLRAAVATAPSTQALTELARKDGVEALSTAALRRARAGDVAIAEALRVTT
jgi:general secretion pathway protein E